MSSISFFLSVHAIWFIREMWFGKKKLLQLTVWGQCDITELFYCSGISGGLKCHLQPRKQERYNAVWSTTNFSIIGRLRLSNFVYGLVTDILFLYPKYEPRHRWKDNVQLDLQEVGWERGSMGWIDMAQDRDRWKALINVVMNLRVP